MNNKLVCCLVIVLIVFGTQWKGRVLGANTPTLVQSATGVSSTASTAVVTLGNSVVSGDVLAIAVIWYNSAAALNTVAATCASGNLVLVDNPTAGVDGNTKLAMAYGVVSSSGSCAITASPAGESEFVVLYLVALYAGTLIRLDRQE